MFDTSFLPETLRSQVGNGSIPAPRWNRALIPIIGRRTLSISSSRPPPRPLPNPFAIFLNLDVMLLLVSTAIVYSTFYSVSATISDLFEQHYPFLSETEIGLCFLSIGGGGACGTVLQGKILDWQFTRVKKEYERRKDEATAQASGRGRDSDVEKQQERKHHEGGDDHEDFPIEKATLQSQPILILLFSAASVGYGWALEKGASLAVPLVMHFIRQYFSTFFRPIPRLTTTTPHPILFPLSSRLHHGRLHDEHPNPHRRPLPEPRFLRDRREQPRAVPHGRRRRLHHQHHHAAHRARVDVYARRRAVCADLADDRARDARRAGVEEEEEGEEGEEGEGV